MNEQYELSVAVGDENDESSPVRSTEAPLASLMRPATLDDFIGQHHLLGPQKLLRKSIEADRIRSLVLYGPPGTGKTTLAHIISKHTQATFIQINAVSSNVAELKKIIQTAKKSGGRFVVFIDEIHRFNKSQQDVLMPWVESGTIVLIGATTHNPFFSINGPLLSRSMVFELKPLTEDDIVVIVKKGIAVLAPRYKDIPINADDATVRLIARLSNGDARRALSILETAVWLASTEEANSIALAAGHVEEAVQRRLVRYDRDGDQHYDIISAFIKSLRGSDPDAAVYWLARMLAGGEDIRFIVRRMLIFAAEDIGNADPRALTLASATLQAVECVGLPEARIILSQCATYLATAPKSNAAYAAINEAESDIQAEEHDDVPDHLKGTGYAGAKKLGRGEGYKYPHAYAGNYVEQHYREKYKRYYRPTQNGYEKIINQLMQQRRGTDGNKEHIYKGEK